MTAAEVGGGLRVGMEASIALGATGVRLLISAGNYGGKLGAWHFHLHTRMAGGAP